MKMRKESENRKEESLWQHFHVETVSTLILAENETGQSRVMDGQQNPNRNANAKQNRQKNGKHPNRVLFILPIG